MNNSFIIAVVLVITASFISGFYASSNTAMVSQSSYHVSVGMPKEKMNWGRGWDSKTSGRAITKCIPGEKKCLTEEGFAVCQDSGTSWSVINPCPELYYCCQALNQCIPRECRHGTTFCRDSVYYLKCVNGKLDTEHAYECGFGCNLLTNKCNLPDLEFPSELFTAFD